MINSILTSIKKRLGITEECTDFDVDIIMDINSALATLNDIGVGKEGYRINSEIETWADFLGEAKNLEDVKTYVYISVKLVFDPSLSSSVTQSHEKRLKEIEWRLNTRVDKGV